MNSELTYNADIDTFFRQIIEDTVRHRHERPDKIIEEYLLGLLAENALSDGVLTSTATLPLSVQLAAALDAAPGVRFERLRKLGDGVLLLSGLYPTHLETVGLEDRYVAAVGQKAYKAAAAILDPAPTSLVVLNERERPRDILGELAQQFKPLMLLLRDIADTMRVQAIRTSRDLTRLVETWLAKRSQHLGHLLKGQGVFVDTLPC